MRRDLADVLRHQETFARNALETLERAECTPRWMAAIIEQTAVYFQTIALCQNLVAEWANQPLSEVGLDWPLGKISGDQTDG